jgi:hypothetical protein
MAHESPCPFHPVSQHDFGFVPLIFAGMAFPADNLLGQRREVVNELVFT